jgi:hypothetical protein
LIGIPNHILDFKGLENKRRLKESEHFSTVYNRPHFSYPNCFTLGSSLKPQGVPKAAGRLLKREKHN